MLQHQGSYTYSVCLSRLPDSGMILTGFAHEDRAPDAESCARPARLVELPALLDHPLDHPDDPTGPVSIVRIDEALNLSRPDPSGADQADAEHQATIWRSGHGGCWPLPHLAAVPGRTSG
jgi:hypothetical protein